MMLMMSTTTHGFDLQPLQLAFGERVKLGVSLSRYTAARVGGPADALMEARSSEDLVDFCSWLWQTELPFVILGNGSNVLVSDLGIRGVVILNKSRQVRFGVDERGRKLPVDLGAQQPLLVWAESGTNFGALARQAAQRGLAGLEWAVGIPGTVGGAVVGNAGAHGGDMAGNLLMAEILHHQGYGSSMSVRREHWPVQKMGFGYRTSALKRRDIGTVPLQEFPYQPGSIVLAAVLRLERSTLQAVQARSDELVAYRRRTQPLGASMGSMFKNPQGDYAGRLIEAAGLKGIRRGDVEISPLHANFFVNHGLASARDIYELILIAKQAVLEHSGVTLELEIELLGEW